MVHESCTWSPWMVYLFNWQSDFQDVIKTFGLLVSATPACFYEYFIFYFFALLCPLTWTTWKPHPHSCIFLHWKIKASWFKILCFIPFITFWLSPLFIAILPFYFSGWSVIFLPWLILFLCALDPIPSSLLIFMYLLHFFTPCMLIFVHYILCTYFFFFYLIKQK